MNHLLILGIPRSGTTWVTQTLTAPANVRVFIEPDNEKTSMLALIQKRHETRFPVLKPDADAPAYKALWRSILNSEKLGDLFAYRGRHQAPLKLFQTSIEKHLYSKENRPGESQVVGADYFNSSQTAQVAREEKLDQLTIVKSVHGVAAAAWLASNFSLQMLWIRRHPLDILASWIRMQLPDRLRLSLIAHFPQLANSHGADILPDDASAIKVLASLLKIQEMQIKEHPEWIVQDFESLCNQPIAQFQQLFKNLGVEWHPACEQYLRESQTPGSGFATNRIAKQQTNKWVKELSPELVSYAELVFESLNLDPYWEHIQ